MVMGSLERGDFNYNNKLLTGIIHLKTIGKCLTPLLLLQESDCYTAIFKLSLLPQF